MDIEQDVTEAMVLIIARKRNRANNRPTVVNWHQRPLVSIGWPLHVMHVWLN